MSTPYWVVRVPKCDPEIIFSGMKHNNGNLILRAYPRQDVAVWTDVSAKLTPVLRHSACCCHRTKRIRDVFLPSLSWLSSDSFHG